MKFGFLLKGLVIGFSIAAPVGPIGIFCIRRTITRGFLLGVTAALGVAVADAIYGSVAAFGLTAVSAFFIGKQFFLRLGGGIFLCYLGCKVLTAEPAELTAWREGEESAGRGGVHIQGGGTGERGKIFKGFLSTFLLTITNPITILSFTAVFASIRLGTTEGDYFSPTLLVLGVFCGSSIWWLILCGTTELSRRIISRKTMKAVNYLSGILIAGFGLYSLYGIL